MAAQLGERGGAERRQVGANVGVLIEGTNLRTLTPSCHAACPTEQPACLPPIVLAYPWERRHRRGASAIRRSSSGGCADHHEAQRIRFFSTKDHDLYPELRAHHQYPSESEGRSRPAVVSGSVEPSALRVAVGFERHTYGSCP
jgi:hypothetical protein